MPTYSYRGTACAHEFDYVQKFSDDPLTECIECHGPVRRVYQPVGVVFKGSGWYINDSRKSASGNGKKDGDSSSTNGKGDTGSASTNGNKDRGDSEQSTSAAPSTKPAPSGKEANAKATAG